MKLSPIAAVGLMARYALLIAVSITALAPGYVMITAAFKTQQEFLASPWSLPTSLRTTAFEGAWSAGLPQWFLNTFIITLGSVAGVMILASLAAWGFAYWRFRGRETILGIVVSLMVVPPVVLLIPLFIFGAEIGWISTFRLVILIYIGLMLPFSTYLLANFFASIPASLLEAAQIDGANNWTVFRRVVLPLSGPPLATLAVVNILWAWNELLLALVFLQQPESKTLMAGIATFKGRYSLDVPVVMAGMTLVVLPLVVAYLFGQRFFIKGLTAGGVKGD